MENPIEPNKEDCCNSGCNPCIFDVYDNQVKLYLKYLETGQDGESSSDVKCSENAISKTEYTQFALVRNSEICESHRFLVFRRSKEDFERYVWWNPGDHFLVKHTSSNGMSCTRAYTPLKMPIVDLKKEDYDFGIIVKRYDGGLVSNILCDMETGNCTSWRGPYGSYTMNPNKFNRIIIIAQGTGIAPFVTILQSILNNEDDMTRIILYFCCSSVDKILLRSELYSYKENWNFDYKVFTKELQGHISTTVKYKEPIVFNRLSQNDFTLLEPYSTKDQFLICGSSEFMDAYKTLLKNKHSVDNIHTF